MQLNKLMIACFILIIASPDILHGQSDAKQNRQTETQEKAENPPKDDIADLAKKVANPISNLISVPLQNNGDYGIGTRKATRNTLNVQPVIPFNIGKNIKLVTRTIVPVISQYNITGEGQSQTGVGDASFTAFFSPIKEKNGIVWGLGPAFLIPIASNDFLATKKFCIGPSAVILRQGHGFTYGALLSQSWSFAGSDNRQDISQMFVQPFITYNWKSGASCGGTLEWTQNWQANTTTIFFTPTIGGLTSLGKQKVSLSVGPRFNIAAPSENKADWGIRATASFLFPK